MTRIDAEEKTMNTKVKLPNIKASVRGVLFLDYADGAYINTFLLFHTIENDKHINPKWEQFGEYTEQGHPNGRTRVYMLDDDPKGYTPHAEFTAAYYAKYPERIEINRQKDIDRQKAQQ